MTAHSKGWTLTHQSLEKLLLVLDPDRDRAGLKYESIRQRLIRLFEWHGCASPDSLTDETIDRVSRRIEEGERLRSGEPAVYFYGVARNVLKEYWTKLQKEKLGPLEGVPAGEHRLEENELTERLECLDLCLAKLPPKSLDLITLYYRSEKAEKIAARAELARELGIAPGTLRIRAHRIRRILETCVKECMERRSDG